MGGRQWRTSRPGDSPITCSMEATSYLPAAPHSLLPAVHAVASHQFPALSIADKPTAKQFVRWLREILVALDGWGEPEPHDALQYGSFVRNAGKIAAYLGYDELQRESLKVVQIAPPAAFGSETLICSQDEAYIFFGKCICQALIQLKSSAAESLDVNGKNGTEDLDDSEDTGPISDKPMPNRFRYALEWEGYYRNRCGTSYNDYQVFEWAKKNRETYDTPLPKRGNAFVRYLSAGRKFLRDAQRDAMDHATRIALTQNRQD